jgi:Domain of unknown function (DUF4167)
MRPGQNNKRMRGRPNGRKGPNPLTRSYESSGPDVKIRGTAQHIGEKYLQLARDAQASGDPVMAESYLQHAEHYFRLIATVQQGQQQGLGAYQSQLADSNAEDAEDEVDFGGIPDRFASPLDRLAPVPQPSFPPQSLPPPAQPVPERPAHSHGDRQGFVRTERPPRPERPFQDRGYRERDAQPFPDKPYQEQRAFQERTGRGRDQENRGGHRRGPRDYRGEPAFRADPRAEIQFAEPEIESNGLPAFITAPVRVAAEASDLAAPTEPRPPLRTDPPDIDVSASTYPPRPRRRRAVKVESEVAGLGSSADENAGDPAED